MCMHVFPNGYDASMGTHLSVCLFLMRGPHDDKLSWPLREHFCIALLNQISDSGHHSMSVRYDGTVSDEYAGRITERNKARRGWGKP